MTIYLSVCVVYGRSQRGDYFALTVFEIDLACVKSVFEQAPDLPDQPPKRAEYKAYRLSCKVASV